MSFRLPFTFFLIYCTTGVRQFTLCKQFQKFMHLPDSPDPPVRHSGSAVGNQKQVAWEFLHSAFVLTAMRSLSRLLHHGLSLPVAVEIPTKYYLGITQRLPSISSWGGLNGKNLYQPTVCNVSGKSYSPWSKYHLCGNRKGKVPEVTLKGGGGHWPVVQLHRHLKVS